MDSKDRMYDSSILSCFNNSNSTIGERLFAVSKYTSFLFCTGFDIEPTEFHKKEAVIFSCIWTIRTLLINRFNLSEEMQNDMFNHLNNDLLENREVLMKLMENNELDISYNRRDFYVSEIKKMKTIENYNCIPILYKLYINPISRTDSKSTLQMSNLIES